MLSDRCCLAKIDEGWLSPQELVSCDRNKDQGCNGGWPLYALEYVKKEKGLVREACFPYKAKDLFCPRVCSDKSDWGEAHVCSCASEPEECSDTECFKKALETGPVTAGFGVCRSFLHYKSGNYYCDCDKYIGLHAVLAIGWKEDGRYVVFKMKNSWGASW